MSKAGPELPGANQGLLWLTSDDAVFFRQRFDFQLEEAAFFEQTAEILFARVAMFTFATVQIFQHLVSHSQSFQVNDANVFVAMFPDLALLEFQWHLEFGKLSLRNNPERQSNYFFLPAACLLATTAFFLAATFLAWEFFWPDFFWFALGDLSPMMFTFLFRG